MRVLIFDTETTGLPEKNASIKEFDKWPYITQLSYILLDIQTDSLILSSDQYIKINENIIISDKAQEITGITHDILNNKGISICSALRNFNEALQISDTIVGHNVSFDKRVIMVECLRNNIQIKFNKFYGNKCVKKPEYCTCKQSAYLFNNKYQRLENLYNYLFNETASGLHNSLIDTIITARCYIKLVYDRDLFITNPDLLLKIKN
jgi:DNA polymerase III epsilon subunit-like protein